MIKKKHQWIFVFLSIFWPILFLLTSTNHQKHTDKMDVHLQDRQEMLMDCFFKNEYYGAKINSLRSDEFQTIPLIGTNNSPDAKVQILNNKYTQKSYLDIQYLPRLEEKNKYQLWVLEDGIYMSKKIFNSTERNIYFLEIPYIEKTEKYIVCVDNEDGNESPNLDKIVCKTDF